jgi:hypothetical protein
VDRGEQGRDVRLLPVAFRLVGQFNLR